LKNAVYEIVKVKDLQYNDQIIFLNSIRVVKVWHPPSRPACWGIVGFGGFGQLGLERTRGFPTRVSWFYKLGNKLGLIDTYSHTDIHPSDPDIQTVMIAEDIPVVRLKKDEVHEC
jgi:hypothetical protein